MTTCRPRQHTRARRRLGAALLTTTVALTMLLSAAPPTPAEPPSAPRALLSPLPSPLHEDPPVPVTPVGLVPRAPDPASADPVTGTPAVTWPTEAGGEVEVPAWGAGGGNAPTQVAGTPVWVSATAPGSAPGTDREPAPERAPQPPTRVRVTVHSHAAANAAGLPGVLFDVSRTDPAPAPAPTQVAVEVDYSAFRHGFGADWAARLQLYALPECVIADPAREECRSRTPIPVRNDLKAGRVSAEVALGTATTRLALAAAPGGSTGDFKADPPTPSATWQVSANSGGFSWNYPMRVPPVPGGLHPTPALSYSTGAMDGRVAATNNQPSWVGDGWDLGSGYITRSFKSCAHDSTVERDKTGDQCWAGDHHVSMVNGGRSTELVHDPSGAWRPKDDDGSRVELLTGPDNGDRFGEHWKVTTTDGTQYFFGSRAERQSVWTVPVFGNHKDEPCHAATGFAASSCPRAWRWNLDHVLDRHGNTISYHYAKETGAYGLNMAASRAEYTRAGTLARVEYGTRADDPAGRPAPARVVFDVADRCAPGANCAQHTPESYPDVPWDQDCAGATCPHKYSPTFWTTKRLAKVTTQVWTGSSYADVDAWSLAHTFPRPGDNTSAGLWLHGVTHAGLVDGGSAAMPAVEFDGVPRANRVDATSDGLPPLNKFRVSAIHNESGGVLHVGYADPDCSPGAPPVPQTNTQRCFPVYWAHDQGKVRTDWFHKYVVAQVVQTDRVGGAPSRVTTYDYLGGGAWRYNDNELVPQERRSWSQWRGYGAVLERTGDPTDPTVVRTEKEHRYYRGMHGDRAGPAGGVKPPVPVEDSEGRRLEDTDGLQGFPRGEIVRLGVAGPVVTDVVKDPWRKPTAAGHGRVAAMVREERVLTKTALEAAGTWRRAESRTRFDDEYGVPVETDDLGDTASAADDRCARTTYARNRDRWLLSTVSRVETVAVACSAPARYPDDAVSDERTWYDDLPWGAAPTVGDPTRVERAVSYRDGAPEYQTRARSRYDAYGRAVESRDALDHATTTRYEPTPAGLLRSTVVTNALGHASTTIVRPEWGDTEALIDPNGRRTDLAYDSLGRLTEVWRPGRAKGSADPHARFRYTLRRDGATAVTSERLVGSRGYTAEVALFDGFLRPRQTQKPGWGGGRVVTDTRYDSRGLAVVAHNAYATTGSHGVDLVQADGIAVPSRLLTEFDGAARPIASITKTRTHEWRTTTRYAGDHVDVIPPAGGTTTATYTDARGRTTQLRQFHGTEPAGAYDATTYTYSPSGESASLTDPVGNVLSYRHDLLGNRIRAQDPDKGTTLTTYDAGGRLRTRTDSRGSTVAYAYDPLGRRTAIRAGGDTGPVLAEWTYDTVPDDAGRPVVGRLAGTARYADGGAYRTAITGYDAGYRATGTRLTVPAGEDGLPGTYETTSRYLADGSLAAQRLPQIGDLPAETLLYTYDSLGLLKTLASSSGRYVRDMHYTAFGEPARVTQGEDGAQLWQSSYYEDGTRRLARTLTERELGSLRVDQTSYGYDPIGNVTLLRGAAPDGVDTQCFAHDHLRRTEQAWTPSAADCSGGPGAALGGPAPYRVGFGYDVTGNRLTETRYGAASTAETVRTYHYPAPGSAQPHAVGSITTSGTPAPAAQEYAYSPTGGTVSRPGPFGHRQTLTWDAEDRPASIEQDGKVTSYVYDAEGTRLITRDPSGRTLHLPDGELRFDRAGGALRGTRYYADGKGRPVAVRVGGDVSYQVNDRHDTGTISVDARTLTATVRRLDPFGTPRGAAPADLPGNRGFAGGTEDTATGLTRLGVRDYDPGAGRFLSIDPKLDPLEPQTLNGFAYSNNNPASFTDPSGEFMCAVLDAPGDTRCANTGLDRPPPKAPNPSTSKPSEDDCRPPLLRCAIGEKHRWVTDLCERFPQGIGCFWRRDQARAEREKAERERLAREEAQRREAARRNAQGTKLDCWSLTVSMVVVTVGIEYCGAQDAVGKGGVFSAKVGPSLGLLGVELGHATKGTQSSIDDAGGLARELSASPGTLGVGVEASFSESADGSYTGGVGQTYGFGGPRVSHTYEFGISWRDR